MKFISIIPFAVRQHNRRVQHAAPPPNPQSHPSPHHPTLQTQKKELKGVVQPLFICYRIYQSHLQSILLVMPCYSPTKIPEKMRSIGKAELFAGIFEPYTAAKPKCMAPSPIGVGRYGFCRTGVVMDWNIVNAEIYFRH